MAVPRPKLLFFSYVCVLLSCKFLQIKSLSVGINYGQIANNLPSPHRVKWLLQSLNIKRVKLYDADPNVLTAFLNTEVEFIVGIGNEHVSSMVDPLKAQAWVQQHVQLYLPNTRITCITVGNEVYTGNDTVLKTNLLPAIQSVYQALVALGLDKQVNITTAHSLDILGSSYPPSAGSFKPDVAEYLQPLLNFHSITKSPFLINAYPYFAYKSNPGNVPLEYVLFQPNAGITDPYTKLNYDNMLFAQLDSVYAAIQAMGHTDIEVKISETGWPSKGDPDEVGANPQYAAIYNGNLLQRIEMKQGTPLRPYVPVDTYVFALFNEDLKPGPVSERNYGLFNPDGFPAYNIGLNGFLPPLTSDATTMAVNLVSLLIFTLIAMFLAREHILIR
ncbi:glycosyl hydrolase superfamily protein [Carex rostrata]